MFSDKIATVELVYINTPCCNSRFVFSFRYVSPRRWASNLQLFPTSPHGSQFGSAWSLTPQVTSPKSATLKRARHHDKEFGDARLWRDRMNARSATLPTPSMDMKDVDSAGQSPLSPNEVFTTTWSLDPNHNVTCLIDVSSDQAKSQMLFDDDNTAVRASVGLAEDMRDVSTGTRHENVSLSY